jgi:hypothetical protein
MRAPRADAGLDNNASCQPKRGGRPFDLLLFPIELLGDASVAEPFARLRFEEASDEGRSPFNSEEAVKVERLPILKDDRNPESNALAADRTCRVRLGHGALLVSRRKLAS